MQRRSAARWLAARMIVSTFAYNVVAMVSDAAEPPRTATWDFGSISAVDCHIAEAADLPLLAGMNRALIEDEGAANRMSLAELEARMRGWLAGEYRAVLFEIDGAAIGYALFRPDESGMHLRQLFIDRAHRRQGLGREAVRRLHAELWPADARISVEVLVGNARGLAFWHAVGFADHAITLTSTQKPASEGDSERELGPA